MTKSGPAGLPTHSTPKTHSFQPVVTWAVLIPLQMTKSGLAGLAGSAFSRIQAFLPAPFLEELCGDLLSTAGLQTSAWQHIIAVLLERGCPGVSGCSFSCCMVHFLSCLSTAGPHSFVAQAACLALPLLSPARHNTCWHPPLQAMELALAEMERPDLSPSMCCGLLSASTHLTALPRARAFWERCATAPDEQTAMGVLQLADAAWLAQDGGGCGEWWAGVVLRMLR